VNPEAPPGIAMAARGAALAILRDEHRIILRALDALEVAARRLRAGTALPDGWWREIADWLAAFADRTHHAKEERALFPAMVAAGLPSGDGPIGTMLAEHVEGRALLRAMADADAGGRADAAERYLDLLRAHIDKENGVLFPLAEALLDEPTSRALDRRFAAHDPAEDAGVLAEEAEARIARLVAALD
jgi:hemerythrin-like domain-containing protein